MSRTTDDPLLRIPDTPPISSFVAFDTTHGINLDPMRLAVVDVSDKRDGRPVACSAFSSMPFRTSSERLKKVRHVAEARAPRALGGLDVLELVDDVESVLCRVFSQRLTLSGD